MKTALFAAMILAFASHAKAQTGCIEVPLTIMNNAGDSTTVTLGLDLTATDGIDAHLGETELPPLPPSGVFEGRLIGGLLGEGSVKNIRGGECASAGQASKSDTIRFQAGGGTSITIRWNLPSSITGRIRDIITGTIIGDTMLASGSFTVANPGVFDRMKVTLYYHFPVPVQLGSFVGYAMQGGVILRWRTISEVNNFGFEIQRKSAQASDYITLPNSFLPGHGSTLLPHDYEFIDRGAGPGRWFYRLRQIDLDGTVHFSDPIQVDVLTDVQQAGTPLQFRLYQNYPNPFNPTTTIRYDLPEQAHVRLALFDMLGREVRVLVDGFQDAGEKRVTLDAAGLASGVYVCRLTAMGTAAMIVVDLLR